MADQKVLTFRSDDGHVLVVRLIKIKKYANGGTIVHPLEWTMWPPPPPSEQPVIENYGGTD